MSIAHKMTRWTFVALMFFVATSHLVLAHSNRHSRSSAGTRNLHDGRYGSEKRHGWSDEDFAIREDHPFDYYGSRSDLDELIDIVAREVELRQYRSALQRRVYGELGPAYDLRGNIESDHLTDLWSRTPQKFREPTSVPEAKVRLVTAKAGLWLKKKQKERAQRKFQAANTAWLTPPNVIGATNSLSETKNRLEDKRDEAVNRYKLQADKVTLLDASHKRLKTQK